MDLEKLKGKMEKLITKSEIDNLTDQLILKCDKSELGDLENSIDTTY